MGNDSPQNLLFAHHGNKGLELILIWYVALKTWTSLAGAVTRARESFTLKSVPAKLLSDSFLFLPQVLQTPKIN